MSTTIEGKEKQAAKALEDLTSNPISLARNDGKEQSSLTPPTLSRSAEDELIADIVENAEWRSSKNKQEQRKPMGSGTIFERLTSTSKRDLYVSAFKGDWELARKVLMYCPELSRSPLTYRGDTALHIATSAKQIAYVTELLKRLNSEDLEISNGDGNTAFCLAALSSNVRIAHLMLAINKRLPYIYGQNRMLPVHMATFTGHGEMVLYLFGVTQFEELTYQDVTSLFYMTISSGMYDISLDLLRRYPTLATTRDRNGLTPMHLLARKPSDELDSAQTAMQMLKWRAEAKRLAGYVPSVSGTSGHHFAQSLWEKILLLEDREVKNLITNPSGILFDAAKSGNVVFLDLVLRFNPYLIMEVDAQKRNLLHISVLNRKESIFNILHNLGVVKDLIVNAVDEEGNNILHFAGKLAERPQKFVSLLPNLQMQRELLWFKEVEKIVPTTCKTMRNRDGMTPRELFYWEHRELFRQSESAVKETANQAMVVATLITTVVFAAALTVPGADHKDKGPKSQTSIFSREVWFIIFIVSNAVALCFSSAAIILLLSIIASKISENELVASLQTSLMFAFTTLFISITSMVIAFTAAIFLIFSHKTALVAYVVALLSCIPVVLFLVVHYSLWVDFIRSYYWSKNLFKSKEYKI